MGLLPDGIFNLGPEAVGMFGVGVAGIGVGDAEAVVGGVRSAATEWLELADVDEPDDVKGHILMYRVLHVMRQREDDQRFGLPTFAEISVA